MAQNRRGSGRGGGFRAPDLRDIRGTLGTLISSAISQASGVRERIDTYRSNQKRNDALAELGEIVLDLVRRGEIDLAELPEARAVVRELDELDAQEAPEVEVARPRTRERFDARTREDDGTASSRTWAPPKPAKPAARVWRPTAEETPPEPPRKALPKDPQRKGGISFGADDDDDDLASYMHPDDVPAKPPRDEE